MRLLRGGIAIVVSLWRLLTWPLQRWTRRHAAGPDGWIELTLEGPVHDHRPPQRLPPYLRRLLRRDEGPAIVLERLHRFVDELTSDSRAKGVLVRVGPLGGGWASAMRIRDELDRMRGAGKKILVHLASHAGNRETLVASAGDRLLMTPSGALAPVGTSASTLFLGETLSQLGIKFEVAAKGRYKSAPDQLTRSQRSTHDFEQTKALVDEIDRALNDAIASGRRMSEDEVGSFLDGAPIVGTRAEPLGYCDGLARDEDLPEEVRVLAGLERAPRLISAGQYTRRRRARPLFPRSTRRVGIVDVHGAIVDRASPYAPYFGKLSVAKTVVNDLRAALANPSIAAVVLHVDSRGGSVTASDAIYSAVRRLNREKPVIACFGDVAASGGYYVACGAREIVCSPLTVTGSIGVFAMVPVWPDLAKRLGVHHDVIKNRKHAALYDPWSGLTDDARAHAESEVGALYEAFLAIVAEARKTSRDAVDHVAEGRVWSGRRAREVGLVDGLGGMPEALDRARNAAGGRVAADPVLVRTFGAFPRPGPAPAPERRVDFLSASGLGGSADRAVIEELALLSTTSSISLSMLAYAPITLE